MMIHGCDQAPVVFAALGGVRVRMEKGTPNRREHAVYSTGAQEGF